MVSNTLGDALTGFLTLPGGQARLHERGLAVSGVGGAVEVRFAFPMLGQPQIITSGAGVQPLFGSNTITFELGGWNLPELVSLIQTALTGRLSLFATAQPNTRLELFMQPAQLLDQGRYGIALSGAIEARQLYDVALLGDGGVWRRVAPHAVYRREQWDSFGIAHITDIHVARRIDRFRELLWQAGHNEAAQHMINWNDRFRGFIRYANMLHSQGELDLILATGDLVDYIYEDDDDPNGGGNMAFFRELILGRAPGPQFAAVEELRVPIFVVPGNHDYRKHPYSLLCDIHLGGSIFGKDIVRLKNFSGYHMLQEDALVLTNRLRGNSGSDVPNVSPDTAARMLEVDTSMAAYQQFVGESGPYVVRLGDHRIVMLDTAHDVGMLTSIADGLRTWLGSVNEDEATFAGGSPNSEGISDAELQVVAETLAETPPTGLVIVGLHAPLFNIGHSEYPYFLRETQRPVQEGQVHGFLVHQAGSPIPQPIAEQLHTSHPTWFPDDHDQQAPRFVKRENSDDLLDSGVARGRAEALTRLVTGIGANRPADLVLAGHIHRSNEFRVCANQQGELRYFMDFYTHNPTQYYPTPFTTGWAGKAAAPGQTTTVFSPERETTYVEVVPGAAADMVPWPLPYSALYPCHVQVPPYANPLNSSSNPQAWWNEHRPLVVQTGALGPLENSQVSFSGFRLLSIKDHAIDKIHIIRSEPLEASQYQIPLAEAIRPAPQRRHRYIERSRPLGAPASADTPAGVSFVAQGARSVVYRDSRGQLHELRQQGDQSDTRNLTMLAGNAPQANGSPRLFIDTVNKTQVVLYRGSDNHVHSLYWLNGAVGHDALSASANAPKAAGSPVGYVGAGGYIHVIYRAQNGHLNELCWHGAERPSFADLTGGSRAPLAAGDPSAYINTNAGTNVVVYRGTDNHIHSLYWLEGPSGYDNLTGYTGAPRAAGDPYGYYTAHNDAHQVTYRSNDGHLNEVWWNGGNPASYWDLTAAANAPLAASDAAAYYSASTNTKHVIYRSADGHLNEIWWQPGTAPAHVDLTVVSVGRLAVGTPTAYTVEAARSQHVVYRGGDGALHEICWI